MGQPMKIRGEELVVDYPCRWDYTVIGRDEARLRAAVAEAVEGVEHELRPSHKSSGGRYLSLALEVEVRDAAHRDRIWQRLAVHADVMYLL